MKSSVVLFYFFVFFLELREYIAIALLPNWLDVKGTNEGQCYLVILFSLPIMLFDTDISKYEYARASMVTIDELHIPQFLYHSDITKLIIRHSKSKVVQ